MNQSNGTYAGFEPDLENYERFTGVMIAAAKKYIPRGFLEDGHQNVKTSGENIKRMVPLASDREF